VRGDGIETAAATSESFRYGEGLQFDVGEGPCLEALRHHETVYSPDLARDERWRVWGSKVAAKIDARSIISYRLFTTKNTLGAMNLYSGSVAAFDIEDIDNGLALAAHVAVTLAAARNAETLERAATTGTVMGRPEADLDGTVQNLSRPSVCGTPTRLTGPKPQAEEARGESDEHSQDARDRVGLAAILAGTRCHSLRETLGSRGIDVGG
jgi:hypothetical protein